jgi:hypothetical protein
MFPGLVEGERLARVLALLGEAVRDDLEPARGQQLARRHLVAPDLAIGRDVEVVPPPSDLGAIERAHPLPFVRAPVAVEIAQPYDAARRAVALPRHHHVDVAVRRHRQVPRGPEVAGHDARAEAGRKLQTAVVGVARRERRARSLCGGRQDGAGDDHQTICRFAWHRFSNAFERRSTGRLTCDRWSALMLAS